MITVQEALVVDFEMFWLVAGGLISIAIIVIGFEVGRLFKLVAAVRDVKDLIKELDFKIEQFATANEREHGDIGHALADHVRDNEHDFDGVKDRLTRVEFEVKDKR